MQTEGMARVSSLGQVEQLETSSGSKQISTAPPAGSGFKPRPPSALYLIFGVIFPLTTFLIEWFTGFCAGVFFDPMPTFWHVAAVAFVPLANLLIWLGLHRDLTLQQTRRLARAAGASCCVALIYSLVFLPLILPAIITAIFGIGLLPLSPFFALFAALGLLKHVRQYSAAAHSASINKASGIGALAAAVVLVASTGIMINTLVAVQRVAGSNPERRAEAIRWLRWFGSEDVILRACYGEAARSLFPGVGIISPTEARTVYFLVTGQPFNEAAAPLQRSLSAGLTRSQLEQERGGNQVGAPVPGLALQSSRLDGTIEPNGAQAYLEWTMEFRNDSSDQAEARAEINLPPGGVVSRLTLWVNGEEREAAFAGKSKVVEAYRNVVVVQRRDPVLVTHSGPDRVLMQCFPVPSGGGLMKVRIGVTAPLQMNALDAGLLRLPMIVDRNFESSPTLDTTAWIESKAPLGTTAGDIATGLTDTGTTVARGGVQLSKPLVPPGIRVARQNPSHSAWARDTRSPDQGYIVQSLQAAGESFDKIAVVIDGSVSMRRFLQENGSRLASLLPPNARVFLALDKPLAISTRDELARELQRADFVGGRDNISALVEAWDYASGPGEGAILWIHGTQPVLTADLASLTQRFERRPGAVALFDLPISPSPNTVTASLPRSARIVPSQSAGTAIEQIDHAIRVLTGSLPTIVATRTRSASQPGGLESNLHLARLWAADEVSRSAVSDHSGAVKIAALYQLVTPVSGAVVLETTEQFKAAGLSPVDAQTVPAVPEPSTSAILLLGAAALLLRKRRASSLI